MHSHRRKNFLLTATILAVVAAVADQSQAQQNNPNMSPGLGGSPSARPDASMFNQGPSVPGAFPGLDTFSKSDARGKQGGSFEDKIIKEQQRLHTKKQDGLEKTKSSSKGTTEGSPQPDPPSRVPGSAAVQPELKAGMPGTSIAIPSGVDERLEDKAHARAIDEIKKLQEAGIGLPERQEGRPGQTSPQLGSGLPGKIPESNAKDPGPKAPPGAKDAEDILAGRGFDGSREDKHDIAKGYPGAAGGVVPDRRGQAGDDWITERDVKSQDGDATLTETYRRSPDGRRSEYVATRNSPEGLTVVRTRSHERGSITVIIEYNNDENGSVRTERWQNDSSGNVLHHSVSVDFRKPFVITKNEKGQPVPDDGRISGRDNCNWAPGIGCLNRRADVKDMIGQPGRGESGGTPVSGLPDSSHVTNPAEGREGPVGFRAPPNPGGPSSPDPSRGGTNPPPR